MSEEAYRSIGSAQYGAKTEKQMERKLTLLRCLTLYMRMQRFLLNAEDVLHVCRQETQVNSAILVRLNR